MAQRKQSIKVDHKKFIQKLSVNYTAFKKAAEACKIFTREIL